MVGIQIADCPPATMEVDDEWAVLGSVIHPHPKRLLGCRKLQKARLDLRRRIALPRQSIHPPVVPAVGEGFDSIAQCRHGFLLGVDVACLGVGLILISVFSIDPPLNVTAVPKIIQVRHGFTGRHLDLTVTNFPPK